MDKKKILIVDDEKDFTQLVKMSLEGMGDYEVRTENDPLEAVAAAREFKPDLILLDIIMPDMDGTEVARKIREDEKIGSTPVVFLTATVTKAETDFVEGGIIGGRAFIAKPVNIRDLISYIEKHTRK